MELKRQRNDSERSFDLRILLNQLFRLWYVVLAIIAACAIVGLFYTKIICTPQYDSTAKLYIGKTTDSKISSSDVAVSTYLASDYAELISDRAVLCDVLEELDLDISYNALRGCVAVDNPTNTRIIAVTVRTGDPRLSKQIAQCVCETAQEKIVDLFSVDFVNIISDAYMPAEPSTPNLSTNLSVSVLIGVLIAFAVLVLASLFNDKLRSADEVEEYLGLSVLAVIPYAKARTAPSSESFGKKQLTRRNAKNG